MSLILSCLLSLNIHRCAHGIGGDVAGGGGGVLVFVAACLAWGLVCLRIFLTLSLCRGSAMCLSSSFFGLDRREVSLF